MPCPSWKTDVLDRTPNEMCLKASILSIRNNFFFSKNLNPDPTFSREKKSNPIWIQSTKCHLLFFSLNSSCSTLLKSLLYSNVKKILINPIRTGGFLPFTQKMFLQPIPKISWLFPSFGCGYPYEIFFFEKFCLHPLTALLWHPVQHFF